MYVKPIFCCQSVKLSCIITQVGANTNGANTNFCELVNQIMSTRSQKKVNFNLDVTKDDERIVLEWITSLKKRRKWTPTFVRLAKLGMALVTFDFPKAVKILMEIQPDFVDWLQAEILKTEVVSDLQTQIDKLNEALERIPAQPAPTEAIQSGPKRLNVPPAAAPILDDDDIELDLVKPAGNGKANQNFLNSLMALNK